MRTKDGNPKGDAIKGTTILVTGATSGLGRAVALALAHEGANVVVHYRHSKREAISLCKELAGMGVSAWPLKADFSNPRDIDTCIARANELAGPLDALVNNASVFPENTLATVGLTDIVECMQINAWAPLALSRAFAKAARRRGGAVVNLLDSRIYGYDWNHVAYILSKQALSLLTTMSAVEFAPNIRVNAVAPGLIAPDHAAHARLSKLASSLPLKRPGTPRDVAGAVLFLLQSPFITGQTIYVDGGRKAREESRGDSGKEKQ
jgi:pteridine reductase